WLCGWPDPRGQVCGRGIGLRATVPCQRARSCFRQFVAPPHNCAQPHRFRPRPPQPDEQPGPDSREAYTIKVTSDGAEIRAKSAAGLFYGVQTLLQLAEGSGAAVAIPEVEIHDWPSLAYRGTMVDMSHGPLPTEEEIAATL